MKASMPDKFDYSKFGVTIAGRSYGFDTERFFGLRLYPPIKPPLFSSKYLEDAFTKRLEFMSGGGPMVSSEGSNEFGFTTFDGSGDYAVNSFAQATFDGELWTATNSFFLIENGQRTISLKEIGRASRHML
jgi:hypothetical protein